MRYRSSHTCPQPHLQTNFGKKIPHEKRNSFSNESSIHLRGYRGLFMALAGFGALVQSVQLCRVRVKIMHTHHQQAVSHARLNRRQHGLTPMTVTARCSKWVALNFRQSSLHLPTSKRQLSSLSPGTAEEAQHQSGRVPFCGCPRSLHLQFQYPVISGPRWLPDWAA